MLGRHAGRIPDVFETLIPLFKQRGYRTVATSSIDSRYLRPFDMLRTIVRHRRDFQLMIVHVYSGPSFIVEDAVTQLGRRLHRPLVLVLSGGGLPAFAERHPAWTRRVLARADLVIAPSGYLASVAEAQGLTTTVIPNPLSLEHYEYTERSHLRPRLLWMRAFHEVYNPHLAVKALVHVRSRHPGAQLTMAGPDKGVESEVRRLAHELGVGDAVSFPGFLDATAKREALATHDVFVNTNRVDNMPVTFLEAGASGVPIVATRVGGIPFLVEDGRSALLVPDGDDAALAAAIDRLLEDPDLAKRLSKGGRAVAEQSDTTAVMDRWEAALAGLPGV